MATDTFRDKNFRSESLTLIASCNRIIADYQAQGYRLTLRQLYYQLVSANIIRNLERSYKNLSATVSDGRLAGLIDWDAIEDRARQPYTPSEWPNIQSLVRTAVASYRLPRWQGQENYVELWVEKEALAGVLRPLASEFHVTLMVNKGYSSQSAMYESAMRMNAEDSDGPKTKYVFYLGDFDPSGEDMVRDVRKRLEMFRVEELTVEKIGLTWEQIRRYNPPPNPAKFSDPRAADYIAQHGEHSWEVDALPPNVLVQVVRLAIREVLDGKLMDEVKAKEEKDKAALQKAAAKIK